MGNLRSGFAHIFLIIVVVIAGVGALGYFAYKNGQINNLSRESTTSSSVTPLASVIDTSKWKSFEDVESGISFKYPENWTADQAPGFSFPVFLKSPKEEFYVVRVYQVKNSDLDKELGTDATINSRQDPSIHINRDIKIADKKSVQVTGKYKDSDLIKGGFVVTMIQHGSDVIKVVLDYDSYSKEYSQILSTFKFVK